MAVYQLTSPQGEKFKITAPDNASQDQVMQYFKQNSGHVNFQQNKEPGLVDSLKSDYAARDQEIQNSVDKEVAGQQGSASTMYQNAMSNASKFTDTVGEGISRVPVVGPALKAATGAIVKGAESLPTMPGSSGPTMGQMLSTEYNKLSPEVQGNLKATGQAINLYAAAQGARVVPEGLSKVRNVINNASDSATMHPPGEPPPPGAAPTTATDIGNMVGQNYDLAKHLNEKFEATQVSDPFVSDIQKVMPKPATANGILSKDQQSLTHQLTETENMVKGQPIDLNGIDTLDKSLAAKIGEEVNAQGDVTPNGRILKQLQAKLRATVAAAPTDGTTALNNGRAAAAARFALNDIEAAELRAEVQGGSAQNYQTQYRRLFNDKDNIMGWPQAARDALQKAATPSLTDKLTGPVATHITALGTALAGHPLGAVAIEAAKLGGDTAKAGIMKKRGAVVKQAVIDHAMSKIKDVNVSAPEYSPQLQLAAPDKMSPLPMSDAQVNIAQQLMNKKPATGADLSGNTVRPEPPTTSQNIAAKLKRSKK